MRTLIVLSLGIVIGAASLGLIWAASDGDLTLRVFGIRHDDGRVEVGLQRETDDGWSDLDAPEFRYIPVDAEPGQRLYSSPVVAPIDTQAETVARDYRASLHQSGVTLAGNYTAYFAATYDPDISTPPILCLVDPEDEGIDSLCHGLAEGYDGEVEILAPATIAEAPSAIEARLTAMKSGEAAALGGWFATSFEMVEAAIRAEEATDVRLPSSFWNELVDQHLIDPEKLFCVISHGGP